MKEIRNSYEPCTLCGQQRGVGYVETLPSGIDAWTQGLPRQPYGSNFDTLFDRVCLTCNGSGEIFDPGFCVMCGRKKPVEICPTCNGTGKTGS